RSPAVGHVQAPADAPGRAARAGFAATVRKPHSPPNRGGAGESRPPPWGEPPKRGSRGRLVVRGYSCPHVADPDLALDASTGSRWREQWRGWLAHVRPRSLAGGLGEPVVAVVSATVQPLVLVVGLLA